MARAARSSTTSASTSKRTVKKKGIKVDQDPFYRGQYTVLKKAFLNFFDPKDNSNKFYTAELHQNDKGEFRYFYNHGRVGSNGAAYAEPYNSLREAESKFEEKVREKLRKGYKHTDLAVAARASQVARTQVNVEALGNLKPKIKPSRATSRLHPKITELVQLLYREANRAVSYSLAGNLTTDARAPLGNLGMRGINAGREILRQLSIAISRRNQLEILRLSEEYYRHVPRALARNLRKDTSWVISTMPKLNAEMDILDLYEDSLRMLPIMGSDDIERQYIGLNCDIAVVEDPVEFRKLSDHVWKTKAPNHSFRLKVVNAFRINQRNAPAFDTSPGNITHLFHGSRNANLVGILSSHLKLPTQLPNNINRTGAMFGPGIYFASESTKSGNYSFAQFGGNKNLSDNAFLFVAEVALGRTYKVYDAQYFTQPPRGYDSVHGVKGRSLINDEFIVYRPNQFRLAYLLEVEKVRG